MKEIKFWRIAVLLLAIFILMISSIILGMGIADFNSVDRNICVEGVVVDASMKRDSSGYTYVSPDGETSYGYAGDYNEFSPDYASKNHEIVIDKSTGMYIGEDTTYILDNPNIVYNSKVGTFDDNEVIIVDLYRYIDITNIILGAQYGIVLGIMGIIISILYIITLYNDIKRLYKRKENEVVPLGDIDH